jgi:hypothetical protein
VLIKYFGIFYDDGCNLNNFLRIRIINIETIAVAIAIPIIKYIILNSSGEMVGREVVVFGFIVSDDVEIDIEYITHSVSKPE